ncbi:leucine-rich repeat domain-containing protein, partial [Skeletonema marinoi]
MAEEFIYMGEPNPVLPPGAIRVIVDESVNIIPAYAFKWNRTIVELICHVGVKKVGGWAFDRCSSLRRVIMPGVEVVEEDAFFSCTALSYVECDKLEKIEEGAFCFCSSLRSINLPSAKIVEGMAFSECEADLSSAKIVGEYAFAHCEALKGAIFGDKLETIKSWAFDNCYSLEQITIPLKDGMFDHDNIFQGCEELKRVVLVGGEILQVNIAIAAFLMEKWRKDMNDVIDSINQILPDTPAGYEDYDDDDVGEKAFAIREPE